MNGTNHLRGARIYLSGPMDFVASRAEEKTTGWRNRVGDFLRSFDSIVFDPWFNRHSAPNPGARMSEGSAPNGTKLRPSFVGWRARIFVTVVWRDASSGSHKRAGVGEE